MSPQEYCFCWCKHDFYSSVTRLQAASFASNRFQRLPHFYGSQRQHPERGKGKGNGIDHLGNGGWIGRYLVLDVICACVLRPSSGRVSLDPRIRRWRIRAVGGYCADRRSKLAHVWVVDFFSRSVWDEPRPLCKLYLNMYCKKVFVVEI